MKSCNYCCFTALHRIMLVSKALQDLEYQRRKATRSVFSFCCSLVQILWRRITVVVHHISLRQSQTELECWEFSRVLRRVRLKLSENISWDYILKVENICSTGDHHPNLQLKSPDKPHEKSILQPSPNTPQNPNLLMTNNISHNHHATTSTQNSNFYENTMHSDTSSAKKRKSVISSQSTGSSNEVSCHINYYSKRLGDVNLCCLVSGSDFIHSTAPKALTSSQLEKFKRHTPGQWKETCTESSRCWRDVS